MEEESKGNWFRSGLALVAAEHWSVSKKPREYGHRRRFIIDRHQLAGGEKREEKGRRRQTKR